MSRRWPLPGVFAALLAFLLLANCDQAGPSEPDPMPVQPEAEVSGDLLGGLFGRTRPSPTPSNLTLIVEQGGSGGLVSGLFGLLGGVLQLDGHSLLVPRGAVLQVTLFTMATPATDVVDVDLNALGGNLLRGVLSRLIKFERPVTVELSYARALNVDDPDDLTIVRLLDNGQWEVVPSTVDKRRKVVIAELDHFSKYAMASN
jgi:hypothetical protein